MNIHCPGTKVSMIPSNFFDPTPLRGWQPIATTT